MCRALIKSSLKTFAVRCHKRQDRAVTSPCWVWILSLSRWMVLGMAGTSRCGYRFQEGKQQEVELWDRGRKEMVVSKGGRGLTQRLLFCLWVGMDILYNDHRKWSHHRSRVTRRRQGPADDKVLIRWLKYQLYSNYQGQEDGQWLRENNIRQCKLYYYKF